MYKSDIKIIKINNKFNDYIAMFEVMVYIIKGFDIINIFNNIHNLLKPNGLFIFDIWNGLGVMRILPEQRIKEVENEKIKIIRFAFPNLRTFDHICELNYKPFILNKKNNMFTEINKKHIVRFYFSQETVHYLEDVKFEILNICPFLNLNGKVDGNVWNMCVITRLGGKKE